MTKSRLLVRTDTRNTIYFTFQIKPIMERNIWSKSTKIPKVKKYTLAIFALRNSRNLMNWVVIYGFILWKNLSSAGFVLDLLLSKQP